MEKRLIRAAVVAAAMFFAGAAHADGLPVNPGVTPQTARATICAKGWTKTARPPVSYTNALKVRELRGIGKNVTAMRLYELDHVIPLELGGAARDPHNLRLQLWSEAREKDHVETCLKRAVCAGRVTLDNARAAIWGDWRAAKGLCR